MMAGNYVLIDFSHASASSSDVNASDVIPTELPSVEPIRTIPKFAMSPVMIAHGQVPNCDW